MEKFRHTRDDAVCGNQFYSMIERVPPEKQLVVKLMVEAFINGMNAEQTISADAVAEARPNPGLGVGRR